MPGWSKLLLFLFPALNSSFLCFKRVNFVEIIFEKIKSRKKILVLDGRMILYYYNSEVGEIPDEIIIVYTCTTLYYTHIHTYSPFGRTDDRDGRFLLGITYRARVTVKLVMVRARVHLISYSVNTLIRRTHGNRDPQRLKGNPRWYSIKFIQNWTVHCFEFF